ncbi:Flagellar protein FliL [Kyrpidia spormannii]|uniref:Flagellar protein FliL n=2 Tax=Kyrpidia spormannii TaxID=2055160 RepID=A0ACA8Z8Z4_9BACL|nr:Flagellar protein FliL [Kyrpidia spormannii]CAB3393426.1 Flagellar protein FliL [Kyrpidia spormannii]
MDTDGKGGVATSKALTWVLIVVLAAAVAVGAWYVIGSRATSSGPPTAADLAKTRYDLPQMTTNLAGGSVIQLSISLQASSDQAKGELELRKVEIQDAVNDILHSWKREDLDQPQGQEKLKGDIMKRVNELLHNGRVTQVYFPSIIVQ